MLVDKSAFFSDYSIGIKRTARSLFNERCSCVGTLSSSLSASKTKFDFLSVSVLASRASPGYFSGFDCSSTCRSNDTWNHNELSYLVACQLSQIFRVFVTKDLDLPVWDSVADLTDCLMIVVMVYFFGSNFKNWYHSLRILTGVLC